MTDRGKLVEIINEAIDIYCKNARKGPVVNTIADHLIANGVTVQEPIKKAEDCRYHTANSFWGAGCLGTKEIDPCKGDGCERWKPKEE